MQTLPEPILFLLRTVRLHASRLACSTRANAVNGGFFSFHQIFPIAGAAGIFIATLPMLSGSLSAAMAERISADPSTFSDPVASALSSALIVAALVSAARGALLAKRFADGALGSSIGLALAYLILACGFAAAHGFIQSPPTAEPAAAANLNVSMAKMAFVYLGAVLFGIGAGLWVWARIICGVDSAIDRIKEADELERIDALLDQRRLSQGAPPHQNRADAKQRESI